MITKEIIKEDNIRKMEYPFGWIPQRFITGGIIEMLNREEVLLYIFLSIVSDKDGMSFYGDKRICGLLGITSAELISARFMLEKREFIAYRKPFYQTLKMPAGNSGKVCLQTDRENKFYGWGNKGKDTAFIYC